MKAKRVEGGPDGMPYKMMVQKEGLKIPGLPNGVPSPADPVRKCDPGLGAKTIAHPYKKGKGHI